MGTVRSPLTGDFGFDGHPWLRLREDVLGINIPAVMFDVAELRANGYDPAALGMVRIGDQHGRFQLPVAEVVADMKSRYDVDLLEPDPPDMNHPTLIIGGVFEDPHPDEWWDHVHRAKSLAIFAGDSPGFTALLSAGGPANLKPIFDNCYVGQVRGLAVRAYDSGVGTAMPGS